MISRRALLAALAGQGPDEPAFRANASLVVAPTTVADTHKRLVHDLGPSDFRLYDDDVPQRITLDDERMPISLVVALHATVDARRPLNELRQAASLFGPLVAGEGGEAAVVAIRDSVEVVVPFTSDFSKVTKGARTLQAHGSGCSLIDAVATSGRLLSTRPGHRRKVIVVMAEARDSSSKGDLRDALLVLQREHATVYALTYSPSLMAFGREVPLGP